MLEKDFNHFIRHVRRSGGIDACWDWLALKTSHGYGCFYIDRVRCLAHRLSYEHFVAPLGNLFCLHKCGNPSCVNPRHLHPGTQTDNMRERRDSRLRTRRLKLIRAN